MSTDARLSTGLPAHPKTKKLIRRVGEAGAWGLVCLILWARDNRPDGDLEGMTAEDIELAVDWRGAPDAFVESLCATGFLDGEEGSFHLHDWEEHQPWSSGSELRSAKARWLAMKRHHGEQEADLRVPEYAAVRDRAACTKNDAPRTKNDAQRMDASGVPSTNDHARASENDASSTDFAAARMRHASKNDAPSPSPSPSPKAKAKAHAPHARSPQEPPASDATPTEAGRACLLLRQAGCGRVNPSHPDLLAAIAEGVTPEAIRNAYAAAPDARNPFAYAIATARGLHADGARDVATGPPRRVNNQPSRTRTALETLQARKRPDELPTRVAEERGARRLVQAGDAEP
jgi:hypothetical protein